MDVGSSFAIYGNLFGWYANQKIVQFMILSGFWMIPYFFIFYAAIWSSRKDGESFSATSVLVKLEYQVYVSLFVIALFMNPVVSVSKLNFQYNNGTTVENGGGASGNNFDSLSAIAPDEVKVPPAWYGVIVFTNAFNGMFKAILPSSGEARKMMHQMQQVKVEDPVVQKEYESFQQQCFNPARLNYANTASKPDSLIGAEITQMISDNETSYPNGSQSQKVSSVFPGSLIYKNYFYGSLSPCGQDDLNGALSRCVPSGDGAAALTPYLSDPNRSCLDWWDDTLREDLTDELNKDSGFDTSWLDNESNFSEALDRVSAGQLNTGVGINNKKGNVFQWVGEKFGAAATNFGSGFGEFTNSVLRFALPILQGIIAMFIIMILPILMLFTSYSVEKVASVVISFFGLLMLPAIWHVIAWMDQVLLTTLWPPQDLVSNFFSISRAAFNFIVLSSYVIFTYLWISLVSSMGGGLGRALSQSLGTTGGNAAGAAAQHAGGMAMRQGGEKGVANYIKGFGSSPSGSGRPSNVTKGK